MLRQKISEISNIIEELSRGRDTQAVSAGIHGSDGRDNYYLVQPDQRRGDQDF